MPVVSAALVFHPSADALSATSQSDNVSPLDRYQFLTKLGIVKEQRDHVRLTADFGEEWDLESLINIPG